MAGYELELSFMIDNGELNGVSQQECFVLGYELCTIVAAAKSGTSFSGLMHAANRDRVAMVLEKFRRVAQLTWMAGDSSEEWMWLEF